ncbi:MAG: tripartite tricarboxylate transporter TctB family protein [Gammaproteobacteria bacterium]|nr:tripartite tricarboxylate transporter TctB family protein [Gammaproteobacteria bacterium]MDH3433934.1 tripartite tricarboxylate transporter TctB family protein [Gammaproteobacteria bacterium]
MSGQANEKREISYLPSVVILLFIVGYLVTGYLTLDETTRLVPLMAAGVTLVLALLDGFTTVRRGQISDEGKTSAVDRSAATATRRRAVLAVSTVAGGVAAIYLVGFLVAMPLYLFASITYLGKQSAKIAVIAALLTMLSIYLVFEVALSYKLFPGVLFS